jgi:hypothetical protein
MNTRGIKIGVLFSPCLTVGILVLCFDFPIAVRYVLYLVQGYWDIRMSVFKSHIYNVFKLYVINIVVTTNQTIRLE